jgi:hypothetical protein
LWLVKTEKWYEKSKCRKYYTKYLSFGFTNIDVDGEGRSLCLHSMNILDANNMRPNKLKRHPETVHTECVGKINVFFHRKLNDFNKQII